MLLRAWYFITLILPALLMGTSFAHTLEMPAKLAVYGLTCTMFQHTLYPFFAYIARPLSWARFLPQLGSHFYCAACPVGKFSRSRSALHFCGFNLLALSFSC